jgi:hypothetical protein
MSVERRPHLLLYDSALKIYLAVPCDFGIGSGWDYRTMIRKENVVEKAVDWVVDENAEESVVFYPPSLVVDSLLEEGGVSRSDPSLVVSYPLSLVVDSLVLRSLLEEGGVSRSDFPSLLGRIHWNFGKRLDLDGGWGFRSTVN